ncbi:MAG TPA: matrixin family metalloprotease [Pyrinomonadaceae bacterium]|nr:matrixin family metalloprotease [Pyrinomonadaceae bacterium]
MKFVLQVLSLLLLTSMSAPAMSAELAGVSKPEPQALRWRTGVVRIAVSSSLTAQNSSIKADSDVLGAVRRSLAAWESVTGLEFRLEFSDRQNVSPSGAAGDGVSLITIAATPDNLQLFGKDPFGESARTRVFFNRRGSITEGDVVLNPLQQFSTDGAFGTFDLETTLTHEIGHLLGLRHSPVTGSIMAERIGRNTDQYYGPRSPGAADLAAVRELYGVESDTCCGSVSGRLSGLAKNVKNATVWLEDADSRVVGQADVAPDGSYRVGGLPDGKFRAFWKAAGSFGELGSATVESGSAVNLSKKVSPERTDLTLDLIGLNMQPGDSAITIRAGRQYYLCVGGSGFGSGLTSISLSSKYLRVENSTLAKAEFGNRFDASSVTITVEPDAPAGVYSLYAERGDGSTAVMVGAVVVTK